MKFLKYVFGPRLFMEYGAHNSQMYEAKGMEKIGDHILSTLTMVWNIGFYSSPIILILLYRRGYAVTESLPPLVKLTTSVGIIIVTSLFIRGFGRLQSASYSKLVDALELSKPSSSATERKREYRRFDFDFNYWSVDYDVNSIDKDSKGVLVRRINESTSVQDYTLSYKIIAYLAIQTFGIRLIYPGSIKILQTYMKPMLITGRAKLTQEENGVRYKIKTSDLNEIDTIFVDNRLKSTNGKYLVICSEGNAGFYEIGIMGTPLGLKYSVLGWNHPGFAGSTGKPFPQQDKNAIEGVIQFAIDKLNFAPNNILLHGWSIGGFSTVWGASCFPNIRGIVLDATFDDLLYLAQARMPSGLSKIVNVAIRSYCNLNISELIRYYHGPLLLIRRTEDEIIAEDGHVDTNRGNYLILSILKYRFPNIFQTSQISRIKCILSKPVERADFAGACEELCTSHLINYISLHGKTFPMLIGSNFTNDERTQMAEFIFYKYFRDYKSTHCTPLPKDYFSLPWDISNDNGLNFT